MGRKITTLFLCFLISTVTISQPPQAFKYQAVVRDAAGDIISNQTVDIRISIRDGAPGGTIVYQETFTETTNQFGLVNLEIGNGTPVTGTFSGIDWGSNSKFLETEIDPDGGNNYISLGTSELLSVPYALYSERSSEGVWSSYGSNLYYDSGFVGIGTSTPYSNLIVKSSGYTHGLYVLADDDDRLFRVRQNSDGSCGIYLYDNDDNVKINLNASFDSFINGGQLAIGNTNPLGKLSVEAASGNSPIISFEKGLVIKDGNLNYGSELEIQDWNGDIEFIVKDGGNVGIGTDQLASEYKLSVNGKVACEEVLVENSDNWPDFVFENNYDLTKLEDLETIIISNKHLPGLPSASEVSEKGFHLAEMQKKLLQKIEELTLYTIEQNKQIKQLQKEIELIKKKK